MNRLPVLFFLVFCALNCYAHEINQPHISVYGTAEKEIMPDLMLWNLKVENKGTELQEVSQRHTQLVKEVLNLLEKQKIKQDKIQATNMSFGENYVYRNNSRVREGYIASTNISFELKDFDKYETLWLALSKIREVSVNGINYDHSQRVQIQDETRIKALMAAKEKAHSLAKAIGQEVGDAIVIAEEGSDHIVYQTNNRVAMESMADSSGNAVSPGTITITMKIKLIMNLLQK